MPNIDPRQAAVQFALKRATLALLAHEIGIQEAVAVIATAMGGTKDETATPRELAADARQNHRASVVSQMMRLRQEGRGRAAAMIMARSNAADPRDPVEVETLSKKYRRWLRAEKRVTARLPASR
jgi:hypothetical protein